MNLDLPWLPPTPNDFSVRCKSAKTGRDLIALASHSLSTNELSRLAGALDNIKAEEAKPEGLRPLTLGLVSNATTKFIKPGLIGTAIRYGIDLTVVEPEYNQVMQTALSPVEGFGGVKPDIVLVCIDHRGLPSLDSHVAISRSEEPDSAFEYLKTVCSLLLDKLNIPVVIQNLPTPPEQIFGSFDSLAPESLRQRIADVNTRLHELIKTTPGFYLLDAASIASTVGSRNWFDPVQWNLAKIPFHQSFTPIFAEYAVRVFASIRGISRKCLVLDLDNTLWSGVIGDDGIAGITIGQGSGLGEAHLELQKTALDLRSRGVILAVCSKNDESIARQPFEQLPDMILKTDHITVFKANWTDKATNIEQIAKELNIGINAIVFVDDNPVERNQVRGVLPEVAVPELPDDVSFYSRTLLAAGYFEVTSFTDEDRSRADLYTADAARKSLATQSRDLSSFLESLNMVALCGAFDEKNSARIAQLVARSNQFNLTTQRYSEGEIMLLAKDPNVVTLQVRLTDRFGDNGLVSVVICRRKSESWFIDTWLMSCRVLQRRLEHTVLNILADRARIEGAKYLRGQFIPSGRNNMVRDHYQNLGFQLQGESEPETNWVLDVNSYDPHSSPIRIEWGS